MTHMAFEKNGFTLGYLKISYIYLCADSGSGIEKLTVVKNCRLHKPLIKLFCPANQQYNLSYCKWTISLPL